MGITLTRKALEQPLRQIVANAGYEASVILNKSRRRQGNFVSTQQQVNTAT